MRLFSRAACLAALIAIAAPAMLQAAGPGLPPQPKSRPAGIPKNAMMVSPCVAGMGYHWANLKDLPLGPIYGVMNGKPAFAEVMIPQADFAKGRSWDDVLRPLPGFTIKEVDIDFERHGHEGYPVPHYDIHAYYVPYAQHMKFCPNGYHVPK